MDYANPQRRKSKNDKRAKARYNRYKRGGALRSANPREQQERGKDRWYLKRSNVY